MKAISLLQPWATLIMLGYKQYETRSWQTNHRGNLAIHASAGKPAWARQVCESDPIIKALLRAHGMSFDGPAMHRGAILGTVSVLNMHPINERLIANLSPREIACGDYRMPGRFAWELFGAVELAAPIPCRGALSVWEVPAEVEAQFPLSSSPVPPPCDRCHATNYGARIPGHYCDQCATETELQNEPD